MSEQITNVVLEVARAQREYYRAMAAHRAAKSAKENAGARLWCARQALKKHHEAELEAAWRYVEAEE